MSKVLDILNCEGVKVGDYELADSVLELEKGEQAVHDAVVAFLAGMRAGTAKTKSRGEVRGGGAKPFRQKGNGKGRAGSSRNPVWTGGGVAFGPVPRSFAKKVNKKVLALALKRAFSERVVDGDVVVVDNFTLADHKTRSAVAVLNNLKVADGTVMLTLPDYEATACCATSNLQSVCLCTSWNINTYDLLLCGKVVFTKDALDDFIGRLA